MVKSQNPEKKPAAARAADASVGYGPNNPEPGQFKKTSKKNTE